MDIKKLLITDNVDEKIIVGLRNSGLTVDLSTDGSPQKILDIIKVSITNNQYLTNDFVQSAY